jgi:hypothetical protein
MYDLHNLGWNSFQQLCLTITREILGQTVESFLDSGDGGRDGAFSGKWKQKGQEDLCGAFVIQCKFTSKLNCVLQLSDLSDEIAKAKRLVAAGLCESYILITNAGLTGTRAEEIEALFLSVGVTHVRTFGFKLDHPTDSGEQATSDAGAARLRPWRSEPDSRRARLHAGANHP